MLLALAGQINPSIKHLNRKKSGAQMQLIKHQGDYFHVVTSFN